MSDHDSSDTDGDDRAQRPVSDRRKRHKAVFADWIRTRVAKQNIEEGQEQAQRHLADEELSIKMLMSQQTARKIIENPRDYQLELFEKAKRQNVIAVLDTGSGKTLVAVLLLRYVFDQELERRALLQGPRIAFFIVGSVALTFQQHGVLKANLDQKIAHLCGAHGVDSFKREDWNKIFMENMAVVCTADVLYNCLSHAYINMDRINLLIFDEAHHAKKNHSFARIIKDFYLDAAETMRPTIFGMTASPVDAKDEDVVQVAKDLEALLHSQIVTAANLELLQNSVTKPMEHILTYLKLPQEYGTSLCDKLEATFGNVEFFKKLIRRAKATTAHLGEWCGDKFWEYALAEEEDFKFDNQYRRHVEKNAPLMSIEDRDSQLESIRAARGTYQAHAQIALTFEDGSRSVSAKVQHLKNLLDAEFEYPTESRCIVFVKQRHVARLLVDLMGQVRNPNLHCAIMIGTRSGEPGDITVSVSQQIRTLRKFQKGEYNCIFATSIAEEGLDVVDCNVVVRFDLYTTMIQYVQSRGRARHRNSKYIHMIEMGNAEHRELLEMVHSSEAKMREFCRALPQDRLLIGNEADLEGSLLKEKGLRVYKEPTTGAKLSYHSSLDILNHFVDMLPHDFGTDLKATFYVTFSNRRFLCEVQLPDVSPVRSVIGRVESRKSLAKRSAAFDMCIALRKGGYLDDKLLPAFVKRLPAMRNAQLALDGKRTSSYKMRQKPDLWEISRGTVPSDLFVTILYFEDPKTIGRPCVPLALLTRSPLPVEIPSFPLFIQPDGTTNVITIALKAPLSCPGEKVKQFTSFTLRIYFDLYNKKFEHNENTMSYWLAPIRADESISTDVDVDNLIDWECLLSIHTQDRITWMPSMPNEQLLDRFIVDPGDGGRRFFTQSLEPNLKPFDPVPEGSPHYKYRANILDYSSSLYPKARKSVIWTPDQPVLRAYKVVHRQNWLDRWSQKEKETRTTCYICPEPLHISILPMPVVVTAYLFPAIIHRIEAYLIAQDACKLLTLDIEPSLALEAVTKDSDNSSEHGEEQVRAQRGMGKNYERLEFLGDAFLKMATSISLYAQNAGDDEFESHVKRMLMLCNKNLFQHAIKSKLYEYIRSQGFSRRTWYPEGLNLITGKGAGKTPEEGKHRLGDKTIADVCEAMIGAALLSHEDMDMAVRAVTICVKSESHAVGEWKEYYKLYRLPDFQTAQSSASQLDMATKVELLHDYRFKHPRLLRCAFTHPSYPLVWERIPNYQRLEFLGDALFDMACVNFLFHRYPGRDPQWLTEHKMAMVCNKFLGALCVRLGFHVYLRANDQALALQKAQYVDDVVEAEQQSNGAVDYWTVLSKDPPKSLPDIVEAYMGAIFVDSGFNYAEVERFFDQHVASYFQDMTVYDTFANNHPIVALSNMLNETYRCSDYGLMSEELPTIGDLPPRVLTVVILHDEIVCDAESSSSKYGKIRAAIKAKEIISGLAPYEYRMKYRCNCARKKEESGDESGDLLPKSEGMGTAI